MLYSRGSRSHSSRRHRSPPQEVEPIIASAYDIVCDVRSPGEFEEDRVLGSTSTPVLNNEERARVGTLYKQVRIAEGPAGRPHHCPFKLDAQPQPPDLCLQWSGERASVSAPVHCFLVLLYHCSASLRVVVEQGCITPSSGRGCGGIPTGASTLTAPLSVQDAFQAKKLGAALVAANLSKILLEHFQDAEK